MRGAEDKWCSDKMFYLLSDPSDNNLAQANSLSTGTRLQNNHFVAPEHLLCQALTLLLQRWAQEVSRQKENTIPGVIMHIFGLIMIMNSVLVYY